MNETDKVLIVDDDELVLICFQRLLGKRFNLKTAVGSWQQLPRILEEGPYAVVLSDMRMKGLTGVELLTQIKTESPATVGLILTGFAEPESIEDAVQSGIVSRVIEKPCDPADITALLCEALEQYSAHLGGGRHE